MHGFPYRSALGALFITSALLAGGCSAIVDVGYEPGCATDPNKPVGANDIVVEVPADANPVPLCNWQCPQGEHVFAGKICVPTCSSASCGTFGACNTTRGDCDYYSCYHMEQHLTQIATGGTFPGAPDGEYPIAVGWLGLTPGSPPTPGTKAYCSGGWTYTDYGLDIGSYRDDLASTFVYEDQLRAGELATPELQGMFRWVHDIYGTLWNTVTGWNDGGGCCFKSYYDGVNDIALGGQPLEASTLGGASACNTTYNNSEYVINVNGGAALDPLPASLFTPGVSAADVCSDVNNPAFFVIRYTGLPSCKAILDAGLSLGDGIYTVHPNGPGGAYQEVVCDMTNGGTTIWEIAVASGMDTADLMNAGWARVTSAQFSNEMVRLALLWSYGRNGALYNLTTSTVGTCEIVLDPGQCLNAPNAGGALSISDGGGACPAAAFASGAYNLAQGGSVLPAPQPRDLLEGGSLASCAGVAPAIALFANITTD